ncbi:MAG: glycoside hydrolase family 88 protein [Marinilabiliales bacterium]|nr:glycoside hydrolase family 88 protein [Marinilabiliales bacterium]
MKSFLSNTQSSPDCSSASGQCTFAISGKSSPSFRRGLARILPLLVILSLAIHLQGQEAKIDGLAYADRMASSEMKHFPEPWSVDFNPKPAWNYTQGLVAHAMCLVYLENGKKEYLNYARQYADKLIGPAGEIDGYKVEEYNIDCVNSGKFLFILHDKTGDERYIQTIHLLRAQLRTQPRTSEGGFWHKQRYPHQMWLDGLYMGAPFCAQYARVFQEPALFDEVVKQFSIVHKHTYNPASGLNYHGWDESKQQKWADPQTGCSPNYWGRAEGWYAMALVDALDHFPTAHPGRKTLISILNQVLNGVIQCQDPETGLWYQVLDQGKREGNYLEATASSMFSYALMKAARLGYVPAKMKTAGQKGYRGIVRNLIREEGDGTLSLTKCCGVAGLGGNPYRDGSYTYYVNELVRDNDPKGVGPFIMASLEYHKNK